MPTPSSRTPIRVARGTYSNLNSSISDLQEGEICYATDRDKLYVVESSTLVDTEDANNAKTNAAQTFSAPQSGTVTNLTSNGSGGMNINFGSTNNHTISLSENLTSVTFSNPTIGQSGSIFISHGSGGPYTVGGWNSGFKFSGGVAPTITADAAKVDRIDYVIRSSTEIQVVWTGNY